MRYRRLSSQVVLGAAIVLLGAVLLLNTTGVYDTGFLFRYVPSVFIVVALYAFVVSGFRNVVGPFIVVVVAGTAQLVALGYVSGANVVQFWPLILVVVGLAIVLGRLRPRAAAVDDAYLDATAVFGGAEQRATSKTFRGGSITALFGGVEIDLRDAEIVDRPATVSAFALFGGAEIVVPREWNVHVDVLPILGAAEDDRPRSPAEHDEVDLVVTGFAAFGGVSVTA